MILLLEMSFESGETTTQSVPLCVDLDGTLIRSDLLHESLLALLRRNPFYALLLPLWVMRGRAYLKRQIAHRVRINPASLPFNEEFVQFLSEEKKIGRRLILTTASDILLAREIAGFLGLFDDVLGSDGKINLKGEAKRDAIQEMMGGGGYDYAGDSLNDMPVWEAARNGVVVRPSRSLLARVQSATVLHRVFDEKPPLAPLLLAALRPYRWVKNLLIFLPFVASLEIARSGLPVSALLAFIAFSLCASGVYVLNDLLDLTEDRAHPARRLRPFASGELQLIWAPVLMAALLGGSAAITLFLPEPFQGAILLYFSLATAYSAYFKKILLVDIFFLAGIYMIRVLAGHAVGGFTISPWMISFSIFLLFSLALLRRHGELHFLRERLRMTPQGDNYQTHDVEPLAGIGIASGLLSTLVIALYAGSPAAAALYERPQALYFVCAAILYWISRLWIIASRGRIEGDPLVFAVKDQASWFAAAFAAAMIAVAAL